ncbi:hypothetical protein [Streptomyces aidingensis]|uniref:Uncharacterized protein n=1 Tax=Streptomyces aidingensis TaxID=910347 RepID=A0A1I1PUZ3_9ACTN|nr:hypothetical protein [Streptomyces aidingensis]SFD13666.1 hypothetical protein SAMN05421773_11070 [Streptomyces aidingensis]
MTATPDFAETHRALIAEHLGISPDAAWAGIHSRAASIRRALNGATLRASRAEKKLLRVRRLVAEVRNERKAQGLSVDGVIQRLEDILGDPERLRPVPEPTVETLPPADIAADLRDLAAHALNPQVTRGELNARLRTLSDIARGHEPVHYTAPGECGPECSEAHTYTGPCAARSASTEPPAPAASTNLPPAAPGHTFTVEYGGGERRQLDWTTAWTMDGTARATCTCGLDTGWTRYDTAHAIVRLHLPDHWPAAPLTADQLGRLMRAAERGGDDGKWHDIGEPWREHYRQHAAYLLERLHITPKEG